MLIFPLDGTAPHMFLGNLFIGRTDHDPEEIRNLISPSLDSLFPTSKLL